MEEKRSTSLPTLRHSLASPNTIVTDHACTPENAYTRPMPGFCRKTHSLQITHRQTMADSTPQRWTGLLPVATAEKHVRCAYCDRAAIGLYPRAVKVTSDWKDMRARSADRQVDGTGPAAGGRDEIIVERLDQLCFNDSQEN